MNERLVQRLARWRWVGVLVVLALVAGLLSVLIAGFPVGLYVIPSGSMERTLHGCDGCTDDWVLVDRTAYWFGDPRPGDVVVFVQPPSWRDPEAPTGAARRVELVKRVVAVGGQTVSCCDDHNRVVVDGRAIDEPYVYFLPEAGPANQSPFPEVHVPAHELWVMGDSRNNSADSRPPGRGPIPIDDVVGQVRWRVLPLLRFGPIEPSR
ncbi:MAG: signal peptidase I [Pseudonocardiales bacterium]|nr:signal peptidase I [Pseudonocardiales bacterium]